MKFSLVGEPNQRLNVYLFKKQTIMEIIKVKELSLTIMISFIELKIEK
jgi:hypothetical protein